MVEFKESRIVFELKRLWLLLSPEEVVLGMAGGILERRHSLLDWRLRVDSYSVTAIRRW